MSLLKFVFCVSICNIMLFSTLSLKAQVLYHSDTFSGGTTAGGWAPGLGGSGTGNFEIFISPGSTIHQAFLIGCGHGANNNFTVTLNGDNVTFTSADEASSFPDPTYGGNCIVSIVDVTTLIDPTVTDYTITCPFQDQDNGFEGYMLYVAYENAGLPDVNTYLYLNDQAMSPDAVYWTLSGMAPFPDTENIAVSMLFDYACSWESDGEYVDVNGTYIGNCGGIDYNSGACATILGNYYYENGTTYGLNNDTADNSISEGDALWNAESFVSPGDTGLDLVMYDGPTYTGFDNGFYLAIFTYGSLCDIPDYAFGNDTTICPGQSAQLFASGGDMYTWTPGASLDDASSPTPVATPAVTTTYEVQIDFNNGCSVTEEITVTVDTDALDFDLEIIDPLCSGNGSIEVTNVSGSTGVVTYNLNGTDQPDPFFEDLIPDDYLVTVTDELGCTGSTFATVDLDEYDVEFDAEIISQLCETPGQIEIISINNGIGPYSYELNNNPESDGLFDSLDAANYLVTITDNIGCSGTQSINVPMENPVITFDTDVVDAICSTPGNAEVFNISGTGPYELYSDDILQPALIADSLQSGNHELMIVDANGCAGDEDITIAYIDPSMASATHNDLIGSIPLLVNFENQSTGLNEFVWSFGNGDFAYTADAVYTYELPGVYTVELFGYDTINGCFDSLSFEVIADVYGIYIPNAFSPDGDGINEYFMPAGSGIDPDNYLFQVFDRWGAVVFETSEIDKPWIGNDSNGEYFVETGVYVYRVEYRFFDSIEMLEIKGHVTLVR